MPLLPLPTKNIENNPMQRKEPLEKKGVAGMDTSAAKNILTRRANQGHISIIPPLGDRPQRCAMALAPEADLPSRSALTDQREAGIC
jgi:hypothetical protein